MIRCEPVIKFVLQTSSNSISWH